VAAWAWNLRLVNLNKPKLMKSHGYGLSFGPVWACIFLLILTTSALAQSLLLGNGDFSNGSGNSPDSWRTQSWVNLPTTYYFWIKPSGGYPGEVGIENREPNDSHWEQPLHLGPGWYYVSAEVKTEGVDFTNGLCGAFIGLADQGVVSLDLEGDRDWQRLGFYVRIGESGADIEVLLRLGGFSEYCTGEALFRGVSVVRVAAPETRDTPAYDLTPLRGRWRGRAWTLWVVVVVLGFGAYSGWRILESASKGG